MLPPETTIERHAEDLPGDVGAAVQALLQETLGKPRPQLAARLALYPRFLVQLARVGGEPAGYKIGYEPKPGQFYSWLGGVAPAHRRRGIARALLRDQRAWLVDEGFRVLRMKTYNRYRGMLLLAIAEGFDVIGVENEPDGDGAILLRLDLVSPRPAPATG